MNIFIKPVNDRQVIDPATQRFVPAEGQMVDEFDAYWQRRLADGDIHVSEQPTETDSATAKSKAK